MVCIPPSERLEGRARQHRPALGAQKCRRALCAAARRGHPLDRRHAHTRSAIITGTIASTTRTSSLGATRDLDLARAAGGCEHTAALARMGRAATTQRTGAHAALVSVSPGPPATAGECGKGRRRREPLPVGVQAGASSCSFVVPVLVGACFSCVRHFGRARLPCIAYSEALQALVVRQENIMVSDENII